MPVSELMRRLVAVYARDDIRYPQLRAVTLAQWMLESGRGTSDLAKLHYNFGGLKWRPEMGLFATRVRYRAHDGEDFYCKFASLESFIDGYWAFISRAPYSGWEGHVTTGEDYIRFIGPVYTPTAGYSESVLNLVPEAQALLFEAAESGGVAATDGATDLGTLIIDPGHGGIRNEPGSSANNAVSISGVKEKKLTLDFCLILRDQLLAQTAAANERIKVVLTRESDVNLAGAQRAGFAFTHQAKALVCLHFNGGARTTRGAETFYRAPENGNLNLPEDLAFVRAVHAGALAGIRRVDPRAPDRGVKPDTQTQPGSLGLLNDRNLGNDRRINKCVAAYIELEYITHPTVERLFISGPESVPNRTIVMAEIAMAIRQHLATLP